MNREHHRLLDCAGQSDATALSDGQRRSYNPASPSTGKAVSRPTCHRSPKTWRQHRPYRRETTSFPSVPSVKSVVPTSETRLTPTTAAAPHRRPRSDCRPCGSPHPAADSFARCSRPRASRKAPRRASPKLPPDRSGNDGEETRGAGRRLRRAAFTPLQRPHDGARRSGLTAAPRNRARRFQSQRDCITQPRVARNELPWGRHPGSGPTLKGLHQTLLQFAPMMQPFQGWGGFRAGSPRVGPPWSGQPWAERWNPVGIQTRCRRGR